MSRADHLGVPVKREDGNVGDARAHHHVHRSPPPFRVGIIRDVRQVRLHRRHGGTRRAAAQPLRKPRFGDEGEPADGVAPRFHTRLGQAVTAV